jgi:hypothetical protein
VANTTVTGDLVSPRSARIEGTIVGTGWRQVVTGVGFNKTASATNWFEAPVQPDGSFAFYNNNSVPVRGRVFALDAMSDIDFFPPSGESAEFAVNPGQLVTGVEVRPYAATPPTSPTTPTHQPSTPVAATDPGLASTGANTVPVAAAGLILLAAGTAVLALERHTRPRRH